MRREERAICICYNYSYYFWHSCLESDFSEAQVCLETACLWCCTSACKMEAEWLNITHIGIHYPRYLHSSRRILQSHDPTSSLYPPLNTVCFRSSEILTASKSGSCTFMPMSYTSLPLTACLEKNPIYFSRPAPPFIPQTLFSHPFYSLHAP